MRDLGWQKVTDAGTLDQTGHLTQINAGKLVIDAGKVQVHIPSPTGLKADIAALALQPGMGWIAQLQNDPAVKDKVDWQQLEEIHKRWDFKQEGLTQEGVIILTLVMAFVTYGAASSAGTGAATAAGEFTVNAGTGVALTGTGQVIAGAVTAGVTTLSTQAAIALVNNKGDIGKALHDMGSSANVRALLTSIVSAGAVAYINPMLNLPGNQVGGDFFSRLQANLTSSTTKALISSAINNTSVEDGLKAAFKGAIVDAAAAGAANWIGDNTDGFANKVAHFVAGCIGGVARSGNSSDCLPGAMGAAIGEWAAESYGSRIDTVQFASMMAGIAVALSGGDANQISIGAAAAGTTAANNYLKHTEAARLSTLLDKQLVGKCDSACTQEINALRELDNARNAQLQKCAGVSTPDCTAARQEVRNAAADYVRQNNLTSDFVYRSEQGETIALAQDTLTGVNAAAALGYLASLKDGFVALASAAWAGFNALVLQDTEAQRQVREGAASAWTFISDPANWPELMGALSAADRAKLAAAYEAGDGDAVGKILGAQVANMPVGGAGMGTIKKIDTLIDAATAAKVAALRADGLQVVQLRVGSKGSWERAINGGLEPKTAYLLDNGHTYVTDGSGRVTGVVGDLDLKAMDRNSHQQCATGKCGNVGDEGGHLIAASLGGAGDKINIVPQTSILNRGDWRAMENEFRTNLAQGKPVHLSIKLGYPEGGGVRPETFIVTAVVDGVVIERRFNQ